MLDCANILRAIGELGGTATVYDVMWWLHNNDLLDDTIKAPGISNRLAVLCQRGKLTRAKSAYPRYKDLVPATSKGKQFASYRLKSTKGRLANVAVLTVNPDTPYAADMLALLPKTVKLCVYLFDDVEAERAAWHSNRTSQGVPHISAKLLLNLRDKYGNPWFTSTKLEAAYYDMLKRRRTQCTTKK